MSAECPCRYKLTELVANHVLGNINRDMLSPVVNGNRKTNHLREDRGMARPGLDYLLVTRLNHRINLLK